MAKKPTITTYLGVFETNLGKLMKKIKQARKDGNLDKEYTKRLIAEAKSLRATIHAAREGEDIEEFCKHYDKEHGVCKLSNDKNNRNPLFIKKDWVMHSGGKAHYKIECDALTNDDIETIAFIIAQKAASFGQEGTGIKSVYGIPRGGTRLAHALEKHIDPKGSMRLIVDDVLTTGRSMKQAKDDGKGDVGVVIFARNPCPSWVKAVFEMHWFNTKDEF